MARHVLTTRWTLGGIDVTADWINHEIEVGVNDPGLDEIAPSPAFGTLRLDNHDQRYNPDSRRALAGLGSSLPAVLTQDGIVAWRGLATLERGHALRVGEPAVFTLEGQHVRTLDSSSLTVIDDAPTHADVGQRFAAASGIPVFGGHGSPVGVVASEGTWAGKLADWARYGAGFALARMDGSIVFRTLDSASRTPAVVVLDQSFEPRARSIRQSWPALVRTRALLASETFAIDAEATDVGAAAVTLSGAGATATLTFTVPEGRTRRFVAHGEPRTNDENVTATTAATDGRTIHVTVTAGARFLPGPTTSVTFTARMETLVPGLSREVVLPDVEGAHGSRPMNPPAWSPSERSGFNVAASRYSVPGLANAGRVHDFVAVRYSDAQRTASQSAQLITAAVPGNVVAMVVPDLDVEDDVNRVVVLIVLVTGVLLQQSAVSGALPSRTVSGIVTAAAPRLGLLGVEATEVSAFRATLAVNAAVPDGRTVYVEIRPDGGAFGRRQTVVLDDLSVETTYGNLDPETDYAVRAADNTRFTDPVTTTFRTLPYEGVSFDVGATDIALAIDADRDRFLVGADTYSLDGVKVGSVTGYQRSQDHDIHGNTVYRFSTFGGSIGGGTSVTKWDLSADGSTATQDAAVDVAIRGGNAPGGIAQGCLLAGRYYTLRGTTVWSVNAAGGDLRSWDVPGNPTRATALMRDADGNLRLAQRSAAGTWRMEIYSPTGAARPGGYALHPSNTNPRTATHYRGHDFVLDDADDQVYTYRNGAYVPPRGVRGDVPRLARVTISDITDQTAITWPAWDPERFSKTLTRYGEQRRRTFQLSGDAVRPGDVVAIDEGQQVIEAGETEVWVITVTAPDGEVATYTLGLRYQQFSIEPPIVPPVPGEFPSDLTILVSSTSAEPIGQWELSLEIFPSVTPSRVSYAIRPTFRRVAGNSPVAGGQADIRISTTDPDWALATRFVRARWTGTTVSPNQFIILARHRPTGNQIRYSLTIIPPVVSE